MKYSSGCRLCRISTVFRKGSSRRDVSLPRLPGRISTWFGSRFSAGSVRSRMISMRGCPPKWVSRPEPAQTSVSNGKITMSLRQYFAIRGILDLRHTQTCGLTNQTTGMPSFQSCFARRMLNPGLSITMTTSGRSVFASSTHWKKMRMNVPIFSSTSMKPTTPSSEESTKRSTPASRMRGPPMPRTTAPGHCFITSPAMRAP